jgi:magnesium transporter
VLVNCVAYQKGRKLAELEVAEISDYLAKPGVFVWVALRDATPEELETMRQEFCLHELAVEDAAHGHQRPKIEEYGASLFVVLQLVELAGGEPQVGEVCVFAGTNFILSVRTSAQQNFLGVRARCEREPDLLKVGPGFVLYALMDAVVDRYFPVLDALETELEAIEERIFEPGVARANVEEIYALKRKVTLLKHAVAPLLEVSGKLHGGRVPLVCAGTQEYFRDITDHLARIDSSIDTMRDTIGTAIAVNLSMATIEESEVTKRLAAWAGIFAVATFLAGLWGMNFKHMPELDWTFGYPLALGIIATACTFVWWRFRKARWL